MKNLLIKKLIFLKHNCLDPIVPEVNFHPIIPLPNSVNPGRLIQYIIFPPQRNTNFFQLIARFFLKKIYSIRFNDNFRYDKLEKLIVTNFLKRIQSLKKNILFIATFKLLSNNVYMSTE